MYRQFRDPDEVQAAVAASTNRLLVIYKHSLTCGVSAMAEEQVLEAIADRDRDVDVYLVPVQSQPEVSRAVAARLGIRHESPQIFVIRDGAVVWHASHFRISAADITTALDAARPVTRA